MAKQRACIYIDQNNIFFRYKKLDFKKLLDYFKIDFEVVKAVSFMSLDNDSESQKKFITYLSNNGYKCETLGLDEDTNIDHILISNLINDFHNLSPDVVIAITGDKHFAYSLDLVAKQGARTIVVGARDYIAYELLKITDQVKYLEDINGVI